MHAIYLCVISVSFFFKSWFYLARNGHSETRAKLILNETYRLLNESG